MFVLGLHGGQLFEDESDPIGHLFHDSAAVLAEDGHIVAAFEEERLNRIKHSNCFPRLAVEQCLRTAGICLADVDRIGVNISKYVADSMERMALLTNSDYRLKPDGEARLVDLFKRAFDEDVSGRVWFCNHHLAHAWSAFVPSAFDESLIVTIDGDGDNSSGMVLVGRQNKLTKLREYSVRQSLGRLYHTLILLVGYRRFDEFKVMGLAPYGDPSVYGRLFESCYTLLPDGDYVLDEAPSWFAKFEAAGLLKHARRKGEPFTQVHMDFAAALQETVERVVFHMLKHYRSVTNQRNLCLAGGVVHNCTMNGNLLRSGLFDHIYAQPAAHDAGGALGAAWWAYYTDAPVANKPRWNHVYLGSAIGDEASIGRTLSQWTDLVQFERHADIAAVTARLLAGGAVVGWVQGRAEFGPRALGNRSILADPRPAGNKLLINEMVKKREQFRPFAPSVLEERAAEYFEIPGSGADLPYMIFVLNVREQHRASLGAITHVDGTARVQTVSRETNPLFWNLIAEFEKLSGIPILLNTSFNNNAEPIVDSVEDALTCFLTTGLQYLIVGSFVVRKSVQPAGLHRDIGRLLPEVPAHFKLVRREQVAHGDACRRSIYELESLKSRDFGQVTREITPEFHRVLQASDGTRTLDQLVSDLSVVAKRDLL